MSDPHAKINDDENWQSPATVESQPVPICDPKYATIAELERAISSWEEIVNYFAKGYFCEDEYTHDLMAREELHAVLNGLARLNFPVSAALHARIAAADTHFIASSVECSCVWGGNWAYDKTIFWYYYRYPLN